MFKERIFFYELFFIVFYMYMKCVIYGNWFYFIKNRIIRIYKLKEMDYGINVLKLWKYIVISFKWYNVYDL